MTRFRAYDTDSEEDVLSDEPSDVEENEASEAESSTNQPDVDVPARRGAVDSDAASEDEDMVADELESRASSSSPPPATNRPADPTLIPWAREVGVDRQKMHVMQTALFRVPEEEAALRSLSTQAAQGSSSKLLVPPLNTRKHSRDSDGEGVRADSRQVHRVATA